MVRKVINKGNWNEIIDDKTFEKCWLVTDIIPKEKETATGEELQKKIEQERFDAFCLGGDY